MGDRRSDGRKVLGQDHRSPVSLPNAQRQSVAVNPRIMCREVPFSIETKCCDFHMAHDWTKGEPCYTSS